MSELKVGDRVRTKLDPATTGWTQDTLMTRRDDVLGTITDRHSGHGLCFSVKHDDGGDSAYEPQELILIKVSKRKFYRSKIVVEVLSEEPVTFEDLDALNEEITTGDCSGLVRTEIANEEIDAKTAAEKLLGQASDPGFFRLTAEGEDTDEYDDEDHSPEEDVASPG